MDGIKVGNSPVTPVPAKRDSGSAELRRTNTDVKQAETKQVDNTSALNNASQTVEQQVAEKRQEVAAEAEKEQQVEDAVQKLSDYVQKTQRSLEFNFDEDAGKSVITVLDKDTNEVIRRIPDDVALDLARKLNDGDKVSLFNIKV